MEGTLSVTRGLEGHDALETHFRDDGLMRAKVFNEVIRTG
jgi:hypothetical protein